MADKISTARRSNNMKKIRSGNTAPEMRVRSLVHSLGYRYRLHGKGLPGKPDLVFKSRKKVIFVHGCFWHQHEKEECLDGRLPKSNTDYWHTKLARNVERDIKNMKKLADDQWDVLVVWECETNDESRLAKAVKYFLKQ